MIFFFFLLIILSYETFFVCYNTILMAGDNRCPELQFSVDFSKINRSLINMIRHDIQTKPVFDNIVGYIL